MVQQQRTGQIATVEIRWDSWDRDVTMEAGRARSLCHVGSLIRSRSEGTLIEPDDDTRKKSNATKHSECTVSQPKVTPLLGTLNPFWNKLAGSNPFLDYMHGSTEKNLFNVSNAKQDPENLKDINNEDSVSTSSDEGNVGNRLKYKHKVRNGPGRWRSASEILDELERKESKLEKYHKPPQPILNPDFEWLKNDREAYKMAWLSHRQLTRSCLDLGLMSQSPGWAQTQATDAMAACKIDHNGGMVSLPDSQNSICIPEGHVHPGEVQEVSFKVNLDPPHCLNTLYTATMSPLLEVRLSNLNTKEGITLELKLDGIVKNDPLSQVMTTLVGLISDKKEGPYGKVNDCFIQENVMQIKLHHFRNHFYAIAAAKATDIQFPATSVWDYLDHTFMVAVYGPRYIHPSFKAVMVVSRHNDIPPRLPFPDIREGNKNLPPVVLHLWGKHQLKIETFEDLLVDIGITNSTFNIKAEDERKEVKPSKLKLGKFLHFPFELSHSGNAQLTCFNIDLKLQDSNSVTIAHFQVSSPTAAPVRSEKVAPKQLARRMEMARSSSIPEEVFPESHKFQVKSVNLKWYGVALKSVLRQPRMEYLLEYFKGDTLALLSREMVRSIGNFKEKQWYIGFCRGRTGLIHCKNIKIITREQVLDFTGINITTDVLLYNMTLPFKKLTYMYSAIQTLVTSQITSWRTFADALGYSNLSLDAITHRHTENEADKVACVLEKLKEDCHAEKSRRKFQHELMIGLLKMDYVSLVALLMKNTVILSTAVELGIRWRELAEKFGKLNSAQIANYEAPHAGKTGEINAQSMWKPAYDFLYSWSMRYGDSYKDMIQDLHLILDKMKNPVTRQWRQLTGALITVNCLEALRFSEYP
ncbi:metastasis-associated in colon cancer protein 1 isoform X2 [Gadus morhua]|uniref:metastasis-associated in colon cancer protein 1 isoform X2 n=1 Tax=Gadus morhua TaxID=8049 RepID=UPI0011B6DD3B|nr:metastasis-associated in colon cancer protein 1 isoform X2 [Gadus morhua]